MIREEQIKDIIENKFSGTDKFLVSVRVNPGNRVVIHIDSDISVTIDDCAELSRYIESQVNRDIEDYELEVSSAGLTHPLVLWRQYRKNVGCEIKTVLRNGMVKMGVLKEISDNNFLLLERTTVKENKKKRIVENIVSVAFDDVRETKIVINI